MNTFELTKKLFETQEEKKRQVELTRKKKDESNANHKKQLEKEIEETLDSFHNQYGITRHGNQLFKNNIVIAELTTEWIENTISAIHDNTWSIKWTIYDSWNCGETCANGRDMEAFAQCMVQWLKF